MKSSSSVGVTYQTSAGPPTQSAPPLGRVSLRRSFNGLGCLLPSNHLHPRQGLHGGEWMSPGRTVFSKSSRSRAMAMGCVSVRLSSPASMATARVTSRSMMAFGGRMPSIVAAARRPRTPHAPTLPPRSCPAIESYRQDRQHIKHDSLNLAAQTFTPRPSRPYIYGPSTPSLSTRPTPPTIYAGILTTHRVPRSNSIF